MTAFTGLRFGVRRAHRASAALLRRALPQTCVLCAAVSGQTLLCAACANAMPCILKCCPRCALASADGAVCGACLAKPPPFDATRAAWRYAFPADRLLHAFKYGGRLALAEPFALALCDAVRRTPAPLPQRLVPMPLSPARQRRRGFNHAHEIARRLSEQLGVPLVHALRRTRDTPPQAGLPLRERMRNVRGAFEATQPLDGSCIALVDDVMTTGATLAAATTAARAAGAARIEAWVVARTEDRSQKTEVRSQKTEP